MRCSKAKEYLSQEMDEQLPPPVTGELTSHLDACAACRTYREDLRLGQRLLAASTPELPENFDWRLQLKLNQSLREAAAAATYPWAEESPSDRWAFLRNFGAAAAVGMAAVLAVAMFVGQVDPDAVPRGAPGGSLATSASPWDDATRRSLYRPGGGMAALGSRVRPVSGGVGNRGGNVLPVGGWSGSYVQDLRTISHLRQENKQLRNILFQYRRQLEGVQTHLDTVPAGAIDLPEDR